MKRIYTLCLGLMAVLAIQAQNDFPIQFADKDGNIIADGTTLTITEIEDDGLGSLLMPSGLYVKNTTNAAVCCAGSFTIQSMSNGAFQSCFPSNCMQTSDTGSYTTENGLLDAGALKSMMTEWLPVAEGTCTVVYQLVTYKENPLTHQWSKDQEGPSITLNFNYDTSGVIAAAATKSACSVTYYSLTGRKVPAPTHGMYIRTIRANGKTVCDKVLIK